MLQKIHVLLNDAQEICMPEVYVAKHNKIILIVAINTSQLFSLKCSTVIKQFCIFPLLFAFWQAWVWHNGTEPDLSRPLKHKLSCPNVKMKAWIWMGMVSVSGACTFPQWQQSNSGHHHTVPAVWVPGKLALGALNHLGHWHGTCTRPLIHTSWRLLPLDEAKTLNAASQDGLSAPTHLRRDFSKLSSTKTGTKSVSLHFPYWIPEAFVFTPLLLC